MFEHFRRSKGWTCAVCGEKHDSLPAMAFKSPDYWHQATEAEQASEFELSSDACIWHAEDATHFFVRCVYEIPIVGRSDVLSFGLWSSLSESNFKAYQDAWDDPAIENMPGMFSYLSNSITGYPETLNLVCNVLPRGNGLRPILEFENEAHPLVTQQRSGVTFDYAVSYRHEHLGI